MELLDTIVALGTPRMIGALAVVRLSGPQSLEILSHLIHKDIKKIKPNEAFLANVYGDKEKEDSLIDQAVITFFKGPRSYTGEDVLEFSLHGSPAIADEVIEACIAYGARPARNGEFTMKAYLNGKMTLLQAEGVDDFIKAQSKTARDLALSSLRGESSSNVDELKNKLLDAISEAEYILEDDLSDHSDYLEEMKGVAENKAVPVLDYCNKLLLEAHNAQRLYEGVDVAIVGKPNVGKSSLLNALVGEDKAIVTSIPGTTRDIVEGEKEIAGVQFRFKDTAGIRPTEDVVERLGVERSIKAIREADIVLYVSDSSFDDKEALDLVKGKTVIKVGSKGDVKKVVGAEVMTSAKEKDLGELEKMMVKKANIASAKAQASYMSKRDMGYLANLASDIQEALKAIRVDGYVDAFSDMLRRGIDVLNDMLGVSSAQTGEDIYTTIFAHFCLGK
mgnify:CR=1 FL=1